jgi:hypothetical protein
VAAFALQLFMAANQRKACFLVMVKSRCLPVRFLVTGFALDAERTAMDVIACMTPITRCRRLCLMPHIGVACVTFDFTVGAS